MELRVLTGTLVGTLMYAIIYQYLMKKLSNKGFKLKKTQNNQLILHPDPEVFDQWGFISEEVPFKQLCLMSDEE